MIRAFAASLQSALVQHPDALVIFTAHSLPARVLGEGDPYDYQAKATAVQVAKACNLNDWRFAYQSQGMTAEKWLGPTVEARLDELEADEFLLVRVAAGEGGLDEADEAIERGLRVGARIAGASARRCGRSSN